MVLTNVRLKNFRNITECDVSFDEGVNLVFGENAQGKTSLLEAIYLLSAGKSFRTRHMRELILHEEKEAFAEAHYKTATFDDMRMKATLSKAEGKAFYKNGVRATKLSEIIGSLSVVLFVPEHLSMVKDGPSVRRAFLDAAISQLYPMYPSYLNEYKKLYEIRLSLIRQAKQDPRRRELFGLYHEPLAKMSAKICLHRRAYVEQLIPHAAEQYRLISDAREELSLACESDLPTELQTEEEIAAFTEKRLEDDLERDIRAGFPVHGVHRDDLSLLLDQKPARSFASQGQQRSIVLALKLSEGEIAHDTLGETPIFLFDDVLSELDRRRRDFVLSKLEGKQTILTFCDPVRKKQLSSARRIWVKEGNFR
ncbi:MAG: DNA replication/repair protein RecF [Clostridia bacterium]|nr:DNA replication/repair protein RecF [Clostridia bacterium]